MSEIRKAFHEELADLNEAVVRLAALVGEAIEAATDALLEADLAGAERIIANDVMIDEVTWDIEDRAFQLLATQQPMAIDLRTLVTIMRIIHELERAGDNIVNVAKATRRLFPEPLDPKVRGLVQRMREQSVLQLQIAVRAFVERDLAQAAALADMDDVMDELQKDLFRWIFSGKADEDAIQRCVQVALIGRYFERIADHAVNFGERVTFMVTGSMVPD